METPATTYVPTGLSITASPTLVDDSLYMKSRTNTIDSVDIVKLEKGLDRLVDLRDDNKCSLAVLACCVVIVAITQGWGFVFGVFQPWFKSHLLAAGMSDSLVVLLPTTQAMMMMLTCGVSGRLADRFGHKSFVFAGCFISVVSVVGCAFGMHVRHLYASQAFQGIGAGLVYPPCVAIVTRSWKKGAHRAVSAILAGIPLYSCLAVLASRALMTRIDHRDTLLVFSAFHTVFLLPSLGVLYRAAPPPLKESITWVDRNLLKDRRFWLLATSMMISAFSLLLPFVFITVYTIDTLPLIQSHPMLSVLPLATVNLFAFLGRGVTLTIAAPECLIAPRRAFACVLLMAALSQIVWALCARTFPIIMLFAMINGFVGGTHVALLPSVVGTVFPRADKTATVGSLTIFSAPGCFFGAFIFNRGLHTTHLGFTVPILCGGMFQLCSSFLAFLV